MPLVAGLWGKPSGETAALLAMALGTLVWLARELMEGLLLTMPDTASATGLAYADYVAAALPRERVGSLVSATVYGFALFPSAISGTAASLLGYAAGVGMRKLRSRAPAHGVEVETSRRGQ